MFIVEKYYFFTKSFLHASLQKEIGSHNNQDEGSNITKNHPNNDGRIHGSSYIIYKDKNDEFLILWQHNNRGYLVVRFMMYCFLQIDSSLFITISPQIPFDPLYTESPMCLKFFTEISKTQYSVCLIGRVGLSHQRT